MFGETTFMVRAPAFHCRPCRATFMSGSTMLATDRVIAAYLATRSPPSGEALRFIRKALGLRGFELAELMGVTGETVSRWENGQRPVDAKAWVVVGSVMLEDVGQPAATMRRLLALGKELRMPKVVRLGLGRPRVRRSVPVAGVA